MNTKLKALLNESDAVLNEAQKTLQMGGEAYDLSEWITIKEYVKRYNLSNTNVVSNWIDRGVIPQGDIVEIPELNSLKLIKNKRYR